VTGLSTNPEPPIDLTPAERAAWDRMPLSKRRLAVYGAQEAGSAAALTTAIVIAAEAKAQGLPFAVGEKLASAVAFVTGSTSRRKVLKQLKRGAAFAYEPTDGYPVLTGCCRDPRLHPSGKGVSSRMRDFMEPYCDDACAKTCPMLSAIRHTQRAVAETDYANVAASSLFQAGAGLGEAGRAAYNVLALLASLDADRNVVASASYLVYKTDGVFTMRALQKALKALHEFGLVQIVGHDKEHAAAIRHVPVHTDYMVKVLERKLGVAGKRDRNIAEAANNTQRRRDWLYDEMTDDEKIEAWNATR
jgi:hypothetical protein